MDLTSNIFFREMSIIITNYEIRGPKIYNSSLKMTDTKLYYY